MSEEDEGPGNPPVPTCGVCRTQHFPSAPCPGAGGDGDDKDPDG